MLIRDEESQIFYKKNNNQERFVLGKTRSKANQERFARQRFEYQEPNRTRTPRIISKRALLASMGVKNPDEWIKNYAKQFLSGIQSRPAKNKDFK